MARVEGLFRRLDALEREYRALIARACRDWLDGKFSRAAVRALVPGLFAGKLWRDAEAARFEYLDKEIRALRGKLSLPVGGSPVSEVEGLRELSRDLSEGERRRMIQDFVNRQLARGSLTSDE